MRLRLPKTLLLMIGSLLISLCLVEGIERLIPTQLGTSVKLWHQLLDGFPQKPDIIRDQAALGNNYQYFDYFMLAPAPGHSKTINFDYYGGIPIASRFIPDSIPIDKAKQIIWLFGGSTLIEVHTPDELTIANTFARKLKEKGARAAVFNFGTGMFHSTLEFEKFRYLLRTTKKELLPQLVLFYDGYNDSLGSFASNTPGSLQFDLKIKLKALVEKDNFKLLIYSASKLIESKSLLWQHRISPLIERNLFGNPPSPLDDKGESTASNYINNIEAIRAIATASGIQPLFVLQPLLTTKKNLTPFEAAEKRLYNPIEFEAMSWFYAKVTDRLRHSPDFIDLSHCLDNHSSPDFFDHGHTGPYTGTIIGEQIAEKVYPYLKRH